MLVKVQRVSHRRRLSQSRPGGGEREGERKRGREGGREGERETDRKTRYTLLISQSKLATEGARKMKRKHEGSKRLNMVFASKVAYVEVVG